MIRHQNPLIGKLSLKAVIAVVRLCLFGQRRTSQFIYYNMSAHNVYYVKFNVVLNNVIFDSCLFPHQH